MDNDAQLDGVFALSFSDGLRAATFALELRKAIVAERRASGACQTARVWMDHPLDSVGADFCCIYLNEAALDAARRARLPLADPSPVRDPAFPGNRLPVVEAVRVFPAPPATGGGAETDTRA